MAARQSIESVHQFLGRLNVPEARIKKVKSMNVLARTKTLVPAKAGKKHPTDKDFRHNLLLELVRDSGNKNYLIVFIRPKNDTDVKGDGNPYMMTGKMLGEDTWSTDEDTDDDVENVDEAANENAANQADNEDPDEADDQGSEDLAYFTGDETIDSDD